MSFPVLVAAATRGRGGCRCARKVPVPGTEVVTALGQTCYGPEKDRAGLSQADRPGRQEARIRRQPASLRPLKTAKPCSGSIVGWAIPAAVSQRRRSGPLGGVE